MKSYIIFTNNIILFIDSVYMAIEDDAYDSVYIVYIGSVYLYVIYY